MVATTPGKGLAPKCGACGFYKRCESPKMPVHGDGAKGVLIVGDFPSKEDDEQGRPFGGESGQYLRQRLGQIGVRLDRDTWTTNALICTPSWKGKADTKTIGYCNPNLRQVLSDLKPRVVLTLGHYALTSVLMGTWSDMDVLERWVGWQIPVEGRWVCPTYHPNFLTRMNNSLMERQFSDHLEAAFHLDTPPAPSVDYSKRIVVSYDDNEVLTTLKEIDRQGGWVAFDYETNSLKPEYEHSFIYSCAVSNGERTIAYLWNDRTAAYTRRFLISKRTRKIASNLKFEERWTLKTFGHGVRRWGWDTMLASHCLDNRPGICSLKFQAFVRMGVPVYNADVAPFLESKGRYNRIREADPHTVLFYNGMDAILEHELAAIQRKDMGYDE